MKLTYKKVISIVIVLIVYFYFYFHRVPDRSLSNEPGFVILSPCDGTVMNAEGRNISIFLSPFDVHSQYVPINSTIKDIQIIHGKQYMANTPESIHNEGVKVVFSSHLGDIEVTQRVGFFVRRIKNKINIGDIVKRGDNYGIIFLGSRVDILLPNNHSTKLKIKDKVFAGITVIN